MAPAAPAAEAFDGSRSWLEALARFGLLLVLTLALIGAWVTREARQRELAAWGDRIQGQVHQRADELAEHLASLRRDVVFMATVPPVSGLVRASLGGGIDVQEHSPRELWRRRLQQIFIGYVNSDPQVLEASYVGVADDGLELVRVDRVAGTAVPVPPERLRAEGRTALFQATRTLNAGEVYVSDLTLRRDADSGALLAPDQPILRASTPIHAPDGALFGMVVIAIDARAMLAAPGANLPPEERVYLTDAAGQFLLHPDAARTFGDDRGAPYRWQQELRPLSAAAPGEASLAQFDALGQRVRLIAQTVPYDERDPGRQFTLALAVPESLIDARVSQARNSTLGALLIVLLLLGGLAALYWRQRERANLRQARLAAIVTSSSDAIIAQRLEGVVADWNPGAEAMFGYRAEEAIGRPLMDLIVPPECAGEETRILARIARGEAVPHLETVRHRRDGSRLFVSLTVSPIRTTGGTIIGAAKTARDITQQKLAEQALKKDRAQLRTFIGQAAVCIAMFDRDMKFLAWSARWLQTLGGGRTDLAGLSAYDTHPDQPEHWRRAHQAGLAGRSSVSEEEQWTRANGQTFWLRWAVMPWIDERGEIGGVLISVDDLTARKLAELAREELLARLGRLNTELEERVQERTAALSASLQEREVLLKEMHHRVKNNLQVVSSLIRMQIRQLADGAGQTALAECESRIQTIALIHEKLYATKNYSSIAVAPYVAELAQSILHAGGAAARGIRADLAIEDLMLTVARAIPCGLMLNELISNALKHAFPDGRPGVIRVRVARSAPESIVVSVGDDGAGLPDSFHTDPPRSLGLQLIRTLARQLEGELTISSTAGAGACFEVRFPA